MDERLANFPGIIDHTLLKADASACEIDILCNEAMHYRFGTVCVNPWRVAQAVQLLSGTDIGVTTVVAFPLGNSKTEFKVAEAIAAVDDGAVEIDLVANPGLLLDDRPDEYEADIRKVRRNLPESVALKVIIEVNLLTSAQIETAVSAAINGGAQYVKSGTGFAGVCTVEQIEQLVTFGLGQIKVKASGGIRTLELCHQLLLAGVDRIGSSASVAIMKEWEELGGRSL